MSDATDKLVACLQDRFGRAISIDVAFSENKLRIVRAHAKKLANEELKVSWIF